MLVASQPCTKWWSSVIHYYWLHHLLSSSSCSLEVMELLMPIRLAVIWGIGTSRTRAASHGARRSDVVIWFGVWEQLGEMLCYNGLELCLPIWICKDLLGVFNMLNLGCHNEQITIRLWDDASWSTLSGCPTFANETKNYARFGSIIKHYLKIIA